MKWRNRLPRPPEFKGLYVLKDHEIKDLTPTHLAKVAEINPDWLVTSYVSKDPPKPIRDAAEAVDADVLRIGYRTGYVIYGIRKRQR